MKKDSYCCTIFASRGAPSAGVPCTYHLPKQSSLPASLYKYELLKLPSAEHSSPEETVEEFAHVSSKVIDVRKPMTNLELFFQSCSILTSILFLSS